MSQQKLILPFADISARDLGLVGGKGANLGEMAHAGFPVPPGFCLTTLAFREFIATHPDSAEIYALLDTVTTAEIESVREVGEKVRQMLLDLPMPKNIVEAIRQSWQEMGEDHAYAVRSSATAEDLPDASFAGQQDTYLNIRGENELLDSIRRCWVSLFTDRAILYRCQNDFSHQDVELSVVVQKMIMAETSGILFTADPLTGHRHTLVIDASFGLGEALVSGLVSPDAYSVDKREQKIIDRQIAEKKVAIYPQKDGGTRQETLNAEKRKQAALTDEQILALSEMGCSIESHYGTPQDIEWAIAEGEIYLLQARPITSLYPIEELKPLTDDGLHIYFSLGHQQMMTRAMSPLSLSSIQNFIPVGRKEYESEILRASGGRLYADITIPLRHPLFKKGIFGLLEQFDALAPEMLKLAMQRPEFKHPHGIPFSFSALKATFGFFTQILNALFRQDLNGFLRKTDLLIADFVQETEDKLDQIPQGKAQLEASLEVLQNLYLFIFNWLAQFIAGEMAKRLLAGLARHIATPAEIEAVSLGLPGNAVTKMNLALGDLADTARQSPQLVDFFNRLGDDSHAWLAEAEKLEGSAEFMEAWENFLRDYGARGSSEIDMMMLRWYEEPLPLLQVIANYLKKEEGSHRVQQEKLEREREAATENILRKSKGLRARLLKRMIYVIYEAGGLREHHKFMAVRIFRVVKEILKKNAQALAKMKKLSDPDDIWYLNWAELFAIWDDDTEDLSALPAKRRADLARYQKLSPPMIITSDGETPVVRYQVKDAPAGALLGNAVSAGVVEGVVRIILDPQKETLNPGEILVTVFTDPGWTPLFINAGGLIMEVGGVMTHGSVVAREYGIPAIVGVRDATQKLKTGQRVRIDGNRGFVEII